MVGKDSPILWSVSNSANGLCYTEAFSMQPICQFLKLCLSYWSCLFWDKFSLYNPDGLRTRFVDQAGLELTEIHLALMSGVLGLQACAATLSCYWSSFQKVCVYSSILKLFLQSQSFTISSLCVYVCIFYVLYVFVCEGIFLNHSPMFNFFKKFPHI